jgi:hypothetical protein
VTDLIIDCVQAPTGNLFANLEAAVELHDLTSRAPQLSNAQLKPEMNLYQQQIQQMRHHQLSPHSLGGHTLGQQHLINHNLTNHFTNHNLTNHQFTNHAQLDDFLSSGVAAVAAAAVANLSQHAGAPQHSLPLPVSASTPDKTHGPESHAHLDRAEHDPSLSVTQLYTPHHSSMNGTSLSVSFTDHKVLISLSPTIPSQRNDRHVSVSSPSSPSSKRQFQQFT